MAIYHLSVKPLTRANGRSATAASAYRAAEKIHDHTSGETFDYTRKRGVEHTEIVLPAAAAKRDIHWARDREQLWNAAEVAENRSNSRVAREYEVALPHEMNRKQRVELVRSFSQKLADRYGVAVDFAIHKPHREGDERNHHAHILTTTRVIEPAGLGPKSEIEWSDGNRRKAGLGPAKEEITRIRAQWAELTNERLRDLSLDARVDHRSLAAQGIEREPTTHKGPAISGMERRGIATEVGKRLAHERREAMQRRIERAVELGRIEREGQEIQKSILDLSGDLEGAKRERDLQLHGGEKRQGRGTPTLEEIQRQGRDQWLALRSDQKTNEKGPARAVDKALEKSPEPGTSKALSPEEQREQAAARWLEFRRTHSLDKGQAIEPDRGREKGAEKSKEKAPENDLKPKKGRDGPEFER